MLPFVILQLFIFSVALHDSLVLKNCSTPVFPCPVSVFSVPLCMFSHYLDHVLLLLMWVALHFLVVFPLRTKAQFTVSKQPFLPLCYFGKKHCISFWCNCDGLLPHLIMYSVSSVKLSFYMHKPPFNFILHL